MQVQESDNQEPSQPEPDPSQEVAPSDPEQADPESPEGEGEQETQGEEPEAVGEEEEKTPTETPETKHKRAGGYQRKIDRLERQNQELIAALTARGGAAATPEKPTKEKTPAEQAQEYINQIVEKRLEERDAQRATQARQTEFQKRTEEARALHEDFEDVVLSVSHVPVSQAVQQTLLTSERGPEIMYQLAKNPAELARISALPPLDAAREIGRLEAKASGAIPQTPKPAVRPPAPPSRVGGSASSTRSLETLPLAEYKRAMASRRR